MARGKQKDNGTPTSTFKVGAIALAFLIIGYQSALFVHRAAALHIASLQDRPDTVFVIDEALAARLLAGSAALADAVGYEETAGFDAGGGGSAALADAAEYKETAGYDAGGGGSAALANAVGYEETAGYDTGGGGVAALADAVGYKETAGYDTGGGGSNGRLDAGGRLDGPATDGRSSGGAAGGRGSGGANVIIRKNSSHSQAAQQVRAANRRVESFRFNPNTVSVDDLMRLGFSEKQALSIDAYRQKGGRYRRPSDFARSYEITYALAERAREATKLEINIAVGPYPVLIVPLSEAYGLQRAEEMMVKGMEDAARDVAEGKAVALGEIGRPHFPVSQEIWDASNRVLLRGMELAKENSCPVIIHCESDGDTDRSLAELADRAGLDRGMVVKHSSPPLVTPEETHGVMPSIPASKTNVREAIGKGTDRFMIETDYIDDPAKPGAIMSVTTVPKKVSSWLVNGQVPVESIHRICGDIPDSLYRRRSMSKITCVYDEGAKENTSLIGARGSAFAVETDEGIVLFDTGLRGRYLVHNLDIIGIQPGEIRAVVISQDNPDNARGLDGLLKLRESPLDVYAMPGMYEGRPGLLSKSAGVSEESRRMAVFHAEDGWAEIVPGVLRTPYYEFGKGYREAFLVVDTPRGLAVVSGFGAEGPERVLSEVEAHLGRKARAFIGSVFLEKKKKKEAEAYAGSFAAHGVEDICLNHSTGRNGMTNVRVCLGLKAVKDFYVGYTYPAVTGK